MVIYFLGSSTVSNISQIDSENTSFVIFNTVWAEKKTTSHFGVAKTFCCSDALKISVQIAYVSKIGCFLICLGLPNWVRLFLVSPNRNISPAVTLHKIQRDNFFSYHAMD